MTSLAQVFEEKITVGEKLYRNLTAQKQALTARDRVNLLAHDCGYHSDRFFARRQSAFQAALQWASQLVRPSLLDFLR